jgi:type II secretory pathway component PulC
LSPGLCLILVGVAAGRLMAGWWAVPGAAAWSLPSADPVYAAGLAAQQHWFGAMPVRAAAAGPLNVKILGVWAPLADPASGMAVLEDGGQHLAAQVGKALPSGWVLKQVQATGVVLSQGGSERFVPLARSQPDARAVAALPPGMPDQPTIIMPTPMVNPPAK